MALRTLHGPPSPDRQRAAPMRLFGRGGQTPLSSGRKGSAFAVSAIFMERINAPFLAAGGSAEDFRAGSSARHCARLAVAARKRHLCEVHRCRCGAVCLMVLFA